MNASIKHGTLTAYTRGCRCAKCRDVWNAYQRRYRMLQQRGRVHGCCPTCTCQIPDAP